MIRKTVLSLLLLLPAAAIWAQTLAPPPQARFTEKNGSVTVVRDARSIVVKEKRIDVDLENATLAEAAKKLAEKAGESVEIEPGLSTDARITLRAHNVSFGTALHLLAENAGAGVAMTIKDGKTAFRLVKSPVDGPNTFFMAAPLGHQAQGNGPFVTIQPGTLDFTASALGAQGLLTVPPTLYTMRVEERRSTFTCPHCKGQVTALRARQEPKCPKCGRPFQGDWQFCPADGTKRPAISTDWRFCPLCGHRVEIEKHGPEDPAK